jgi:hypothetical protein
MHEAIDDLYLYIILVCAHERKRTWPAADVVAVFVMLVGLTKRF